MRWSTLFTNFLAAATTAASPASTVADALSKRQQQYSHNWCGKVLPGSQFTEIGASWTMPSSTLLSGQGTTERIYNYQWVGFDGSTNDCLAILQAGTYATTYNGSLYYGFWYEFYPDSSYLLDTKGPAVRPGDTVYVKVVATSQTTGYAFMENLSTSQNITVNMQAPTGSQLCQNTVDWIQENSGGNAATLAPFSTFSFDNCQASDASGKKYDLQGSDDWIMQPAGSSQLCHPSGATASSVTINYDG